MSSLARVNNQEREYMITLYGVGDHVPKLQQKPDVQPFVFSYDEAKFRTEIWKTGLFKWEDMPECCRNYHFTPGHLVGNRCDNNVKHISLLAYDIDEGDTLDAVIERLKDAKVKAIIGATRNNQRPKLKKSGSISPACDRIRIILDISRIIMPDEYLQVWKSVKERLFPTADESTKNASHFFFPCREILALTDGEAIDVDACLASADTPKLLDPPLRLVNVPGSVGDLPKGLRPATTEFLLQGAEPGRWNKTLFASACDLRSHGYNKEVVTQILSMPTRMAGFAGKLDDSDLRTIDSSFEREVKEISLNEKIKNFVYTKKAEDKEFRFKYTKPDLLGYFREEIYQVLNQNFRYFETPGCRQSLFKVVDAKSKVVAPIEDQDGAGRKLLNKIGERISKATAIEIFEQWRSDGGEGSISKEPLAFAFKSEYPDRYAVARIADPVEGKFPAWQEFLDRLTDPDAFMAWIWSIFAHKHCGRQVLYLNSEGENGMSKALKAVCDLLGDAGRAINDSSMENKKHLFASLEYARLAVYPDCKNAKIVMSEMMRNLTGGDPNDINPKGKQNYTKSIYLRFWVCSNEMPAISAQRADVSRLIIQKVKDAAVRTPGWADGLKEEMPAFLFACRKMYKEKCPDDYKILINAATEALIKDACGGINDIYDDFIFDQFDIFDQGMKKKAVKYNETASPDGKFKTSLKSSEFWKRVECIKKWTSNSYPGMNLKRRLEQLGVEFKRDSSGVTLHNIYYTHPYFAKDRDGKECDALAAAVMPVDGEAEGTASRKSPGRSYLE